MSVSVRPAGGAVGGSRVMLRLKNVTAPKTVIDPNPPLRVQIRRGLRKGGVLLYSGPGGGGASRCSLVFTSFKAKNKKNRKK